MTAVFSIALEHLGTIGDTIMANYYSSCRSNYFRVSQPAKFIEWVHRTPYLMYEEKTRSAEENDMVVMIYVEDPDGGGWPSWAWDEENDEEYEIDITEELSQFICDDDVAILFEVGAEKLRYLTGYATAVNSKGETLHVNICDIYDVVKSNWGLENILSAEY